MKLWREGIIPSAIASVFSSGYYNYCMAQFRFIHRLYEKHRVSLTPPPRGLRYLGRIEATNDILEGELRKGTYWASHTGKHHWGQVWFSDGKFHELIWMSSAPFANVSGQSIDDLARNTDRWLKENLTTARPGELAYPDEKNNSEGLEVEALNIQELTVKRINE